jgi:hypothetical protein
MAWRSKSASRVDPCQRRLTALTLSTSVDEVAKTRIGAYDGPPANTLAQLRQLVDERAELERRESTLVRRARNEGFVWEQIAACLNVSRQAVHKKHAAGRLRRR